MSIYQSVPVSAADTQAAASAAAATTFRFASSSSRCLRLVTACASSSATLTFSRLLQRIREDMTLVFRNQEAGSWKLEVGFNQLCSLVQKRTRGPWYSKGLLVQSWINPTSNFQTRSLGWGYKCQNDCEYGKRHFLVNYRHLD